MSAFNIYSWNDSAGNDDDDDDDDAGDILQLFERETRSVDSRRKMLSESAPFVIKNDTDMTLVIVYGKYYRVSRSLTNDSALPPSSTPPSI